MPPFLPISDRDRDRKKLLPAYDLETTDKKARRTTTVETAGGGTTVAELGAVVSYDTASKTASVSLAGGTESAYNYTGFGLTAGDAVAVVRREDGAAVAVGMARTNTTNPPPYEQVILEAQFPIDTGVTPSGGVWSAGNLTAFGLYANSAAYASTINNGQTTTNYLRVYDLSNVQNYTDLAGVYATSIAVVGGQIVFFNGTLLSRLPTVGATAVTLAAVGVYYTDQSIRVVQANGTVKSINTTTWAAIDLVGSQGYSLGGATIGLNHVWAVSFGAWYLFSFSTATWSHVGTNSALGIGSLRAVSDSGLLLWFESNNLVTLTSGAVKQTFSAVWDSTTYGTVLTNGAAIALSDTELVLAVQARKSNNEYWNYIAVVGTGGTRIVWSQLSSSSQQPPASLQFIDAARTGIRWRDGSKLYQGSLA